MSDSELAGLIEAAARHAIFIGDKDTALQLAMIGEAVRRRPIDIASPGEPRQTLKRRPG